MHSSEAIELTPWAIVSQDGPAASLAVWRIARPNAAAIPDQLPLGAANESVPVVSIPLIPDEIVQQEGELALAIFSSRAKAEEYQQLSSLAESDGARTQFVQLAETQLLQVLMAGYRQGMRYAALDPSNHTARQIFVLRDVLRAAQHKLRGQTETPAN
jgi:hypothetical protein